MLEIKPLRLIRINSLPRIIISKFRWCSPEEFVISYLLRSTETFIGNKPKNYYPSNANITLFRSTMGLFAKEMVLNNNAPWYIHQQAILFLLTNQNYGFKINKGKMLESYKYLYDSALYFQHKNNLEKRVITSFVAQQINANHEKYVTWFFDIIKVVKKNQAIRIFDLIKDNRPDLYKAILKDPEAQKQDWYKFVPESDQNSIYYHPRSYEPLKSNQFIPLGSVIQNKNNPFKQENALLKLIAAILKSDDIINGLKVGLDLNSILIRIDDWEKSQDPCESNLDVMLVNDNSRMNRIIDVGSKGLDWIKEDYKWLNNLGKLIRSAFIGEYDYTSNANITNDIGVYKGIQSNSLIRSFSLINIGDGITNTEVPITPWLSELLYSLLQWPGIEQWNNHIIELNAVEDANDLLLIINSRLEYQRKLYGVSSSLPVYSIPIAQPSLNNSSSLRFVIVQTMLPQVEDFNEKDPLSWSDNYRQAHKDHVASISHLIHKHVEATNTVEKLNKKTQVRKNIDIIVFPELSVHPDDVHLLERLSNDTGAHIFAGLLFHKESGNKIVNQGLWILRDRKKDGTNIIKIKQGKYHMTSEEKKMGIQSFRPYQLLVELIGKNRKVCLSSSICYDATDIALAADLKNLTDIYFVAALNRDINTFDNMVAYLHYHMYQPIVLANSGEFGGSTAQAPYSGHDKIIAHVHGNQQIAVSLFDVDPEDFNETLGTKIKGKETKAPPAG